MSKSKHPSKQPFRRSQVVSPVPSGRRYGKVKFEKKYFDIYVTDKATGEEILAITIEANARSEAEHIGRKRLWSSPLLRKITDAVFTAVEVELSGGNRKPK